MRWMRGRLYKLLLRTMYRIIFVATIEERDLVFLQKTFE